MSDLVGVYGHRSSFPYEQGDPCTTAECGLLASIALEACQLLGRGVDAHVAHMSYAILNPYFVEEAREMPDSESDLRVS